jgi:hypothetical protein
MRFLRRHTSRYLARVEQSYWKLGVVSPAPAWKQRALRPPFSKPIDVLQAHVVSLAGDRQ